jgi:hypothetical protein
MNRRTLIATVAAGLAAAAAHADLPPLRWLTPAEYSLRPGQTAALTLKTHDDLASPWPAGPVQDFCLRFELEQRNDDRVATRDNGLTAEFTAPPRGVAMTLLDFQPVELTVDVADLRAAAENDGLAIAKDCNLPAEGSVRVRRLESLKLVTRVRGRDTDEKQPSAIAMSKTAQHAEIRLISDPTTLTPGADLPLRLYADGAAIRHGVVIAEHVPTKTRQRVVADRGGIATLRSVQAGAWRLSVQVLRPAIDPTEPRLDWFVGAVSFEVPARPADGESR